MGSSLSGRLQHHGFDYHYRWLTRNGDQSAAPTLPPVLFLGGAFQSMTSWNRFVQAFRPQRDVVLVDLPGTGSAQLLPAKYGLDLLVGALERLVRHLSLSDVFLVAASYGSPIAYGFARHFPETLSRLVLTGIARSIPDHVRGIVERSIGAAKSGDREALIEMTITRLLCTDASKPVARRRLAARVLAAGIRQMSADDLSKYVANSRRLLEAAPLDLTRAPAVEALVFTGEHDVFTSPNDCLAVAQAIEGAAFTTIPHADHLFHIEQFDATKELLFMFGQGALDQTSRYWADAGLPQLDDRLHGIAAIP